MLCDPGLMHSEPLPLHQDTADPYLYRRHSNTQRQVWLSLCGVSGSWCTQSFVWALRASLEGIGLDSKHDFAPHPPCCLVGASPLPLHVGYLFLVGSNILLLMVVQQRVALLELSQEKMNVRPSTTLSSLCHRYCLVAQLCLTLLHAHRLWPARLLCLWDFLGKNTGVGCHFFLRGLFPTRDWTHVSCIAPSVHSHLFNK